MVDEARVRVYELADVLGHRGRCEDVGCGESSKAFGRLEYPGYRPCACQRGTSSPVHRVYRVVHARHGVDGKAAVPQLPS